MSPARSGLPQVVASDAMMVIDELALSVPALFPATKARGSLSFSANVPASRPLHAGECVCGTGETPTNVADKMLLAGESGEDELVVDDIDDKEDERDSSAS